MQSSVTPIADAPKGEGWGLAAGAVIHALLLLAWWWAAVSAGMDIPLVNGRVWLVLVYAWLVWPFLFWRRGQLRTRMALALVFGAALVAPTVPTVFAFSVWAFRGFAP